MNDKIIEILEDILEEDGIHSLTELDEDNWDSLNVISFIAAINTPFQVVLDAEKISEASTVGELMELVERAK